MEFIDPARSVTAKEFAKARFIINSDFLAAKKKPLDFDSRLNNLCGILSEPTLIGDPPARDKNRCLFQDVTPENGVMK